MADLKSTVIKTAKLTLGHKTREEVRKPWVTDEMIDMMVGKKEMEKHTFRGRPQEIKITK